MSKTGAIKLLGVVAMLFIFQSCKVYSLSPPYSPDIKTVTVFKMINQSANGSSGLAQGMTDKLRERFINQTSIKIQPNGSDIEFKGTIIGYDVSGNAPGAGEVTALNRLTLTVKIEFINYLNRKQDFTRNFKRFADYDSSSQLQDVEDQLLEDIYDQLVEDIFNAALVRW